MAQPGGILVFNFRTPLQPGSLALPRSRTGAGDWFLHRKLCESQGTRIELAIHPVRHVRAREGSQLLNRPPSARGAVVLASLKVAAFGI